VTDSGPADLLLGPNSLAGNVTGGVSIASPGPRIDSVPHRRLTATVGASKTAVPHGLPYAPRSIAITMLGPGSVWKSAAADATNVYLTADAAGRSAEVLVG
jgi:hypothetical protein